MQNTTNTANTLKMTTAIQFVFHSLISILLGAFASGIVTVGELAFTGKGDLSSILLTGLGALFVYFTTHLKSLWASPQTMQALLDAYNELKASYSQLAAHHQWLSNTVNAIVQANAGMPVQVHVTTPPASAPVPVSATASQAASQPAPSAPAPVVASQFSLPTVSGLFP